MQPGEEARVKRTMAEIRLEGLGIATRSASKPGSPVQRISRNAAYKLLRERGYEYSPRYHIWSLRK